LAYVTQGKTEHITTILEPELLSILATKKDGRSKTEYLSTLDPESMVLIKWQSTGGKEPVVVSSIRLFDAGREDAGDGGRGAGRRVSLRGNTQSSTAAASTTTTKAKRGSGADDMNELNGLLEEDTDVRGLIDNENDDDTADAADEHDDNRKFPVVVIKMGPNNQYRKGKCDGCEQKFCAGPTSDKCGKVTFMYGCTGGCDNNPVESEKSWRKHVQGYYNIKGCRHYAEKYPLHIAFYKRALDPRWKIYHPNFGLKKVEDLRPQNDQKDSAKEWQKELKKDADEYPRGYGYKKNHRERKKV